MPPAIQCAQEIARVAGSAAFVVCTAVLEAGELVATNLFVREAGDWKHHHAGPVAADADDDDEPRSGFLN